MKVKWGLKTDLQTWKTQIKEFGVYAMDLCVHGTGETTTLVPHDSEIQQIILQAITLMEIC